MLVGVLVGGGSVLNYSQLARMTPQYAELVTHLERAERAPGQAHAALDHARSGLAHLRTRDATRWQVGGYALTNALGVGLGAALLAFGFRTRTG